LELLRFDFFNCDFFGAIGGYFGGKVDANYVARQYHLVDTTLLLVIAITLALGKEQVFCCSWFNVWVEVARVVRVRLSVSRSNM
jgi:ABC-type dipeptide/oligopeptide/nickel transport system permease subunit